MIIGRRSRSCQSRRRGSWSPSNSLCERVITSVEHDEGEDEEAEGKDGGADCAEAVGPLPLPLLDGEVFEGISIVPEHFELGSK